MTEPRERPILFSAPMVRAILAGAKTQTRRVAEIGRPRDLASEQLEDLEIRGFDCRRQSDGTYLVIPPCPYGQRGDRLWLREAWRTLATLDAKSPAQIGTACVDAGYRTPWAPIEYRADGRCAHWDAGEPGRWRVGMHLPRWASRLALEITDVRVERLQAITLGDIVQEVGAASIYDFKPVQDGFRVWRELWDSLNAKRGLGWDVNPWVWAVSFRRAAA